MSRSCFAAVRQAVPQQDLRLCHSSIHMQSACTCKITLNPLALRLACNSHIQISKMRPSCISQLSHRDAQSMLRLCCMHHQKARNFCYFSCLTTRCIVIKHWWHVEWVSYQMCAPWLQPPESSAKQLLAARGRQPCQSPEFAAVCEGNPVACTMWQLPAWLPLPQLADPFIRHGIGDQYQKHTKC